MTIDNATNYNDLFEFLCVTDIYTLEEKINILKKSIDLFK